MLIGFEEQSVKNLVCICDDVPLRVLLRYGFALSNGVSLFLFAIATKAPLFTKSWTYEMNMFTTYPNDNFTSVEDLQNGCFFIYRIYI